MCMAASDQRRLITPSEFAKHMRVSRRTVYRMCNSNPKPKWAVKVRSQWRIDIDEYLAQSENVPA